MPESPILRVHTELEAEGGGGQESLGLKTISACGKEQWGKEKVTQ